MMIIIKIIITKIIIIIIMIIMIIMMIVIGLNKVLTSITVGSILKTY